MKKLLGTILCLALFAVTVTPVMAQSSRSTYARGNGYGQYQKYEKSRRDYRHRRYENRSFWDKHRDKLTVAAGTGAGAAIGAVAGGKKGAIIGALLGAGGSALYTYGLRDRDKRKRYRR